MVGRWVNLYNINISKLISMWTSIIYEKQDGFYKTNSYILVLNVLFRIELHDKIKEFAPAPEPVTPSIDWLNSYQKNWGEDNMFIKSAKYKGYIKLALPLLQSFP